MMDEYLWNKTGSDPEIERIEAALECLAYRPTAPPEIPAKQMVFALPRRSLFRLSLSFAAGLLALVALGSAWTVLRDEKPADQRAEAKTVPALPVTAIRTEAAPAVAVSPKASPVNKPRRKIATPRPQVSNTIRPQTLVLTREEADAYRQLMTALSITSTNLKIVKDKIDGTE